MFLRIVIGIQKAQKTVMKVGGVLIWRMGTGRGVDID